MASPIFLLAPAGNMTFAGMPSGSAYVSNAYGLVTITNGSVGDELALIQAGCLALEPNVGGVLTQQSGSAYTIQTTDQNNTIEFTAGSATTATLPNSFPVGFAVTLMQGGGGTVSAAAATGGSVVSPNVSATQNQYATLLCIVISNTTSTNAVWDVISSPTPILGIVGAANLSALFTQDSSAHYAPYTVAQVLADGTTSNNGTWLKTGTGNGSGNWTQESTVNLTSLSNSVSLLQGVTVTQGVSPPVTGAGTATQGSTWFGSTPISNTGFLTSVSMYATNSATVTLVLASFNSGGTQATLQQSVNLNVGGGQVNTFNLQQILASNPTFNPSVQSGWYVGVYSPNVACPNFNNPSGITLPNCTGLVGTNTPVNYGSNLQIEMSWSVESGVAGETARAQAFEALLVNGQVNSQGTLPASALGNFTIGAITAFPLIPISESGYITHVEAFLNINPQLGSTTGALVLASMNSSNQFTLIAQQPLTNLVSGRNAWDGITLPAVQNGQFLGLFIADATNHNGISYGGSGGAGWVFTSGVPGTNTASSAGANATVSLGWEINSIGSQVAAAQAESAQTFMSGVGLAAVEGADPSGANDSTNALLLTKQQHPTPYLPPGIFSVTSLSNFGKGFYGAGNISINGTRYFTHRARRHESLLLKCRAAFARQISSSSPLIFIGDSETTGFQASSIQNSWLNLIQKFLNVDFAPGSEPGAVIMSNTGTETAAWYGITNSGTVTLGINGPLGTSTILAAGAAISFTGTYANIGFFYTQQSTAGSVQLSFNGTNIGSAINCGGATVLDQFSGLLVTGHTTSGTYALTNTGSANVELTGLLRLQPKLSTPGTPNQLYVMRNSHGNYAASNFGSAQMTSIMKQAQFAGGTSPEVTIMLGVNEYLGNISQATYFTNLTAMVNNAISGGASRVNLMGLIRPDWTIVSGSFGVTANGYDSIVGGMQQVCDSFNGNSIPVRRCIVDSLGLDNDSLLYSDGIHPLNAGHDQIAQRFLEWRTNES